MPDRRPPTPRPPRRRPRPLALGLGALAVLALVAGCSSDDDAADDATTTTEAETTTTEAPATSDSTPVTAPDASDDGSDLAATLVGGWTAEAADIFAANTANTGGGGVSCTGPIVMTFAEDGTYTRSGEVTCEVPGGALSGTGTIATSGRWEVDGDGTLVITDTVNEGTVSLGGQEAEFPDAFGDAEADATVEGDVLRITFTIDPVGTVTQEYARA